VLNCNGEGIYLNKASGSEILFNALAQTGGITFRYPGSTGIARGNLLTSAIRAADGAHFATDCNVALAEDDSTNQICPWDDSRTQPAGRR
jgi:hypothetical protein